MVLIRCSTLMRRALRPARAPGACAAWARRAAMRPAVRPLDGQHDRHAPDGGAREPVEVVPHREEERHQDDRRDRQEAPRRRRRERAVETAEEDAEREE